jgi:hypothetical protein
MNRRSFVFSLAAAMQSRGAENLPPIRPITKGPKFHWFAYYDKLQFDPTGRYVLAMETDFENRTPEANDSVRVGMIDLKDNDRWTDLGQSLAWNWQQGCMLQWLPGSQSEVIWNDRQGDKYVSHILDVTSGKKRTLPAPVYAISPDGATAMLPDFRRLHHLRPGYGYAGIPDPSRDAATPGDAGIWRMDLRTGKTKMVLTFEQAAKIPSPHIDMSNSKHWFNHLLFAPDGKRFVFLHRWKGPKQGTSFTTRMFTGDVDCKDLYVLDPWGKTSHFIWRDSQHVLAWANHPSHGDKFYLYRDKTENVEAVGPEVMTVNGHCTYLPGNRWILNDTYPDKQRLQHPYLFDTKTGTRVPLAHLLSPPEYTGEWRCDNHPRFSRDGKFVTVDSPHAGNGRQIYLIDISVIVG